MASLRRFASRNAAMCPEKKVMVDRRLAIHSVATNRAFSLPFAVAVAVEYPPPWRSPEGELDDRVECSETKPDWLPVSRRDKYG